MYRRSTQSPRAQSLHSRRRRPPLVRPERATRLRFRTQESLEEIHYIVHAPPAYHYSLDGFADEEVEENWEAEELTVPELRAALSKRRLPTGGRKMDLVERLSGALQRERTERRQDAGVAKRRKLDDILSAQQDEMEDRLEASNLAAPPNTTSTSTSTSTTTTTTTATTDHGDDHDRDANNDSTTNFSFFFNSLEAESSSPPRPSASSSSDNDHGHGANGQGGPSRKRKAPEEDEQEEKENGKEKEIEEEKEAAASGPPRFAWGAKEEADGGEDGLVSKLTRFLEQVPSSPSRAAAAAAQRKPELLPEDLLPAAAACSSPAAASTPPTAPALPISSPPASPMRRPLKGVLKRREVKAPEDMTAAELKEHLIAYGVAGAALKQKKAALVTLLHKTIQQHSKKATA